MKRIGSKILFTTLLVAFVGILGMIVLYGSISKISEVNNNKLSVSLVNYKSVSSISINFKSIQENIAKYVMTDNQNKSIVTSNEIAAATKTIEETFSSQGDLLKSVDEDAYNNLVTAYEQYMVEVETVLKMSEDGDKKGAQKRLWSNLTNVSYTMLTYLNNMLDLTYQSMEDSQTKMNTYVSTAPAALAVGFILIIVFTIFSAVYGRKSIVKPIERVTSELNRITLSVQEEKGDLSIRVPDAYKDEIGILAKDINKFLDLLQVILGEIVTSCEEVNSTQEALTTTVSQVNANTQDTTLTMQGLRAGMQEVSSNVISVNTRIEEVEQAIGGMDHKAKEGSELADEIKGRAERVRKQAVENQTVASTMLEEMEQAVTKSVEETKQITEVNKLTAEILGIAEQTNLLAFNASIEAARAGSVGQGFAVIAEEIRILADTSRVSARDIQVINNQLVDSVTLLSENAMKLLAFINNRVITDYNLFVKTGDNYLNDAVVVDEIMKVITASASELKQIMSKVAAANAGISETVTISTEDIIAVADNMDEIDTDMNDITKKLQDVSTVMDTLRNEVNKFVL